MNETDRYSTPPMDNIWSLGWKYRRWADVEIAAAEAQGAPPNIVQGMRRAVVPSAEAVAAEEAKTRHDVFAFLNTWRADMADEDVVAWTHRGLTSSDVVDTANGLRFKASTDVIRVSLGALIHVVGKHALMYKDALRVGRTHGQLAEVTTWGWRLAVFFFDLQRAEKRLNLLSELYEVGKLSGPVGDYKSMSPAAELKALQRLGLHGPGASTQIVTRDTYVDYVHALAQIASVIENIATEIRLSARAEVAEMREGFSADQRGSSAMPHKRNPITSEQLCGLARVVRAQVDAVARGVAVHHERDISHSSTERFALAIASKVTDYMVTTATRLVANLRIDTERMRANAEGNLELLSSLIKNNLVDAFGCDPQLAYDVVFWGFESWGRPDNGGFETLADSLSDAWQKVAVETHNVLVDPPDFEDLVAMGDDLDALVDGPVNVYREIEFLISHEALGNTFVCGPAEIQ